MKLLTMLLAAALARPAAAALWNETFPYPDGVITNEYAYAHPTDPAARLSTVWTVEQGTLRASSGAGWTGVPDSKAVNAGSTAGTGSSAFVARTLKSDFGSVELTMRLWNQGLTYTASTPRTNWDGAHVLLRYQNADNFYSLSVNRRDNTAVIKKRRAGAYSTLGSVRFSVPYRTWQAVKVSVKDNANGSVGLYLTVNGRLLLSRTDSSSPILGKGAIALRGDNAELKFDDMAAESLAPVVDAQAPVVAITAPQAGAALAGAAQVLASASDNTAVAGVQFFLDGAPLGAEDAAAPYAVSWDTVKTADGAHVLTATARDAAGNRTTSAAVSVTVANTPAAPPADLSGAVFSDTFDRADGPVDPAKWAVTAGSFRVSQNRGLTDQPLMLAHTVPATFQNVEVAFSLLNQGFLAAAGDAWDGVNVVLRRKDGSNGYYLSVNRRDGRTVLKKQTNGAYADLGSASNPLSIGQWQQFRAVVRNNPDGSVGIELYKGTALVLSARDSASAFTAAGSVGLRAEDVKAYVENFRVTNLVQADGIAPTVQVTQPAAGATVAGTVALAAGASDNVGVAGVQFMVDGAAAGAEDAAAPFEASWDSTKVPDGAHVVTAVARDAAGNKTTSAPVSVTVKNAADAPPPPSTGGTVLFSDDFNRPDGSVDTSKWEVTSGVWRIISGRSYSESSVFRANTRSTLFRNVEVSFTLTNAGLTSSSGEAWHGVHMFLRRQSEYHTYYVTINRRDNRAILKKKVPGGSSNGGTYYDLASAAFSVPYNQAQQIKATAVNNSDGSVTVTLFNNGRQIVTATDRGTGGPPITNAGSTGVRGDYTRMYVDDFYVRELGGASAAAAGVLAEGAETADASPLGTLLWSDSFDRADGPVDSSKWHVTSGVFRVIGGRAYSDSGVFRADTRQANFGNVDVSFTLTNAGLTTGRGESWHGVHMFLRRQSEFHTYYLSINRRDNRALIKKKVPGGSSNGGTYYDLASVPYAVPYGRAQQVAGRAVNNADGSVTVTLYVDGRLIATATDRGTGGAPIRAPGGTGVRGDYTKLYVDNFTVSSVGGGGGSNPPPPAPPAAGGQAKAPQKFLSPALADGINDSAEFGSDAEEVTVFDASGRQVYTITRDAAGGRISWPCRDNTGRMVESGVYIARIRKKDSSLEFQNFAVVK